MVTLVYEPRIFAQHRLQIARKDGQILKVADADAIRLIATGVEKDLQPHSIALDLRELESSLQQLKGEAAVEDAEKQPKGPKELFIGVTGTKHDHGAQFTSVKAVMGRWTKRQAEAAEISTDLSL